MRLAPIALAAGLALTGVTAGTVATAAPAEAATCCYKMPAGTWGARYHYYDVHAYWHGDREVRYREDYRRYWDGKTWSNRIYYRGYYYSGVLRA